MECFPLSISHPIGTLRLLCHIILSMVYPRVLGADLGPGTLYPPWPPTLLKLHPSVRIFFIIFYIYLLGYVGEGQRGKWVSYTSVEVRRHIAEVSSFLHLVG